MTTVARESMEVVSRELARPPAPLPSRRADYNISIGYLRAFVRLLVFALHSLVAYYPGPAPAPPLVLRMSIPIWDPRHFAGTRILIAFNEITAMSLMFFLSGLFLWPSLSRKGARVFLRERTERLGLPFLVSGGLIAALAYYPSYLQATGSVGGLGGYFSDWMSFGRWMTGPAWFLIMLFGFDLIAAAAFVVAPAWGRRLGELAANSATAPLRMFAIVVAVSAAAYVPMAVAFGPYDWWRIGPIWMQKCRTLQYGAYFFLGAAVGALGLNKGLVSKTGALARAWPWWTLAMIAVFLLVGNAEAKAISAKVDRTLLWGALVAIGWVICCATCSFALISLFVRFAGRHPLLDAFANNSYGIYLIHYPFVTWTQYELLHVHISPILKGVSVVVVAIGSAWAAAAALRRIPAIRRIV